MHLAQLLFFGARAWVPPSVLPPSAVVNGTVPELATSVYGRGDTFLVEPGWNAVIMGGPTTWSADQHAECAGALFIYVPERGTGLEFRVRDPVAVARVGNWNGSAGSYVSGAVAAFTLDRVGVLVTDRPLSCDGGMGDAALKYAQASLSLDGHVLYLVSVWSYHHGKRECVADTAVPGGDIAVHDFRSWDDEVSEKCVIVGAPAAPAHIDNVALVAIVVSSVALALSCILGVYVLVRACTALEYRTPLTTLTEVIQ
jgi:hypothetical protein